MCEDNKRTHGPKKVEKHCIRRYGPQLNGSFSMWPPSHINCSPLPYDVMVSFTFLCLVCHNTHCFLLLASCMFYVVKQHFPEDAYLNTWAKRRQNNKIIVRRSNLSALIRIFTSNQHHERYQSMQSLMS